MTATEHPRQLRLTPAALIPTRRQRWMWEGRIPLGTATVFAGRGGEGKSTFALYLASLLNKGELPGDLRGHQSDVLIISHEDDWGTVMNPRLVGAGANLHAIHKLTVDTVVDDITAETIPALPLDLGLIRQAVRQTGARMLIIDPITSTISGDLHKVADVRRALDPLTALAQELDIAVIGIMHFNKGTGNASDKLSGSHAFRDAVRSLLLFATDEETGQRVVTVDKSNYSQQRGSSFAFNLISSPVYTDDGNTTEVGTVQFLGDTDVSVNDIINRGVGEESDGEDAETWLTSFLIDAGGSAPAKQIMNAAVSDGFSKATIQRVGKRVCDKSSSGFQGSWTWTLRQGSHQGSQGSHPSERENYENHGENYGQGASREGGTKGGEGGTFSSPATFAPPLRDQEPEDKEVAPVSYLDHRPEIVKRADMLCPVCGEPVGMLNPGYCDKIDNAHANHRADAEVPA